MRYSSNKFYCFSPPVMLATIIIEIGLLLYTAIRYPFKPVTRIVMVMLFLLALFQMAEYSICGRLSLSAGTWSRMGYVAITLLPALGIHLIQEISKRGTKYLKYLAYANASVWVVVFGFSNSAFRSYVCEGNYVIFHLTNFADSAFFYYYYFWLGVTLFLIWRWAKTAVKSLREALILVAVGYLVFLVPTTVINGINADSRNGVPSIMCGFAVIYAIILVFGVLPMTLDKQDA